MQAINEPVGSIVVLNYGEKLAEGLPARLSAQPAVIEPHLGDPEACPRAAGEPQ